MKIVNGFVVGLIVGCLFMTYSKPVETKQCTLRIGKTLVQGDAIN